MGKLKGKARAKANRKKKNKDRNSYFLRKKELLFMIKKWNDPILKETCSPVDEGVDCNAIIKKMKSILMLSDRGLGIAASQIGYAKRIFITRPKITSNNITVFINATIVSESEERSKRGEGCLSYPGFVSVIDRPAEITVEYEDEKFKVHSKRFKGLDACVVCHEHDHTLGVCLVAEAYFKSLEEQRKAIESEKVEESTKEENDEVVDQVGQEAG